MKIHPLAIGYGFAFAFFSSFGQTFLIALFNPNLRVMYQISQLELGTIYSLATFCASLFLSSVGKLLDKKGEDYLTGWTIFTIFSSYLLLISSSSQIVLFISLFLLRLAGQMTLGIIGSNKVAKLFGAHRGKALSLCHFGRSLGEGTLAPLFSFLVVTYSFNSGIYFLSALLLLFYPFTRYAINRLPKTSYYDENLNSSNSDSKQNISQDQNKAVHLNGSDRLSSGSLKDFFREKYALALMLVGTCLPLLLTGLFYTTEQMALALRVDLQLITNSFILYSIGLILANIISGQLVDRLGVKKVLRFSLLPFFLGIVILVLFQNIKSYYLFTFLMSFSVSFNSIAKQSFYAHYYSHQFLGRIRGLEGSIIVFSTSMAPFLFSFLLERKIELFGIWSVGIFFVALCQLLYWVILRGKYYEER